MYQSIHKKKVQQPTKTPNHIRKISTSILHILQAFMILKLAYLLLTTLNLKDVFVLSDIGGQSVTFLKVPRGGANQETQRQSTLSNINSRGGSTLTSTLTKKEDETEKGATFSLTESKKMECEAEPDLFVTKRDGSSEPLSREKVRRRNVFRYHLFQGL